MKKIAIVAPIYFLRSIWLHQPLLEAMGSNICFQWALTSDLDDPETNVIICIPRASDNPEALKEFIEFARKADDDPRVFVFSEFQITKKVPRKLLGFKLKDAEVQIKSNIVPSLLSITPEVMTFTVCSIKAGEAFVDALFPD